MTCKSDPSLNFRSQTQSSFRFRNLTNDKGEGHTMCSLYWQLNDVWAATTWSSIDFELKWKAAHYEARRFLDNLIVVLVNHLLHFGFSLSILHFSSLMGTIWA